MSRRRRFRQGRGLFVTGTDTGVGKTLVTGAIADQLAKQGYRVGVFKPIATGCHEESGQLRSYDGEFLHRYSHADLSLDQVNPIRYTEALSPLAAVRKSGRKIDWKKIEQAYAEIVEASEVVIVEGIGGLMVPLEEDYLVRDMIKDFGLPVLIVGRKGLGTINHTLLTVEACRASGLEIAGVVLNSSKPEESDEAAESNPELVREVGKVKVVAVIPYCEDSCIETLRLGQTVRRAVEQVDWAKMFR